MSETMANEDKKEIKQQSEKIETATLDSKISPEEITEVNDAVNFLKTKTEENDIEINKNINTYKSSIESGILEYFRLDDTRLDQDKIKSITDPEVAQAYINLIGWTQSTSLDVVKEELNNQIEKIENAKKIQTYQKETSEVETKEEEAKKPETIQTNNTIKSEEAKKIETTKVETEDKEETVIDINKNQKNIKVTPIIPEINNAIVSGEKRNQEQTQNQAEAEKQKAIDILSTAENNPKKLFETGSEADFNVVMNFIGPKTISAETISTENGDKAEYEREFLKLINSYKETTEATEIKEITIDKAVAVGQKGFGDKFTEGTWLIRHDKTEGKEKYVLRGTNEYVEENKAKRADLESKFKDNLFDVGYTGDKKGMDTFNDDTGNFEGLRIYMNKQNAEYMKSYLPNIMAGIREYKTNTGLDLTFVKNGYANVLTDYVIAHPELTGVYFDNFNPNDLNLLGANETTRTNNYNRLLFSDIKNDVLRPEIQNYITSLTPEGKQQFLSKIGNIKEAITGKGKMSTTETLQQGFDKLIDQFGPILFNVLKFFGMNKTSLLKRFPNSEARINEEFQKEYGLGEDKKTAVDTIANTIGGNTKFDRDYEKNGYPTAKDLKENFTKTNDYVGTYITELIKNDKSENGTNNLQYLNLSVFDTAVKTYNKRAEQKVNILDIVDIETKKIDGKEMKSINKIKDGQNKIFTDIMTTYLNSDIPWINVANSNKQITTETTYKEGEIAKLAGKNEQGIDINQAKDYRITTQQQLVKYLTASLFSNKDLSYVMTENGLKGEHVDKNINNEPKNTKLDIQQKYIADDGTLKNVEPVTINDIFTEFDKAPDNLMFTKKGETVGKEVKKGEINGKKTYIYDDTTKVTIHDGDKIEAISPTATTTVVENKPSEEKA